MEAILPREKVRPTILKPMQSDTGFSNGPFLIPRHIGAIVGEYYREKEKADKATRRFVCLAGKRRHRCKRRKWHHLALSSRHGLKAQKLRRTLERLLGYDIVTGIIPRTR